MICPHCDHDNIAGVDLCEECGMPLVHFDFKGSELEESIARHNVEVLCPKEPFAVASTVSVRDAIRQMVDRKIGCLLVVNNGELVGVFSERDVLNKVASNLATLDRPVGDFMTTSPVSLIKQDSIAYALHAMKMGGYRHLPVLNDAKLPTGIISVRDILRFLCIRFAELRTLSG